MEFIMRFESMPKGTAQQKGVSFKNGYPRFYTKSKVRAAQDLFAIQLKDHIPEEPFNGPVRVFLGLYFDVKQKSLWGKYKDTRPDAENYIKLLLDVMTDLGYWKDDSQVVDLRITKSYASDASIFVRVEEIK